MKTYIKYSRPYNSDDDEPPIEEIWSEGDRPKKKLADFMTLFVSDDVELPNGKIECHNERIWDGIE